MSCCCGGESYAEKKAKKNKSRQLAQDQDVMSGTFVGNNNNSNNGGIYPNNDHLHSKEIVYNCGEAPAAGGKYLNKINLFPKGNTNYYQKHNGVDSRGNKMNINNNDKMGLPTWSMICKYQPVSIFGKTTILQEEKSQCGTNSLLSKTAVNNQKTQNDKNPTEVLIKEIDDLNRMTCNSINSINSIKNNHVRNTYFFESVNFNDKNEINNNDVKNEFPSYSELQSQYGNENNSNKINFSTSVVIAQNNKQYLPKAPLANNNYSHIDKAKALGCFWKKPSDNETSSNNDPMRKCIVINKGTNTIKKLLSKQNNIKLP